MFRILALLLLILSTLGAEEGLSDVIARTTMSDPDSVFELAQWCAAHNMPSKANTYYHAVIKLEKDHDGARTALNQVKVGDKWMAKSMVKTPPPKPGGEPAAGPQERQATGTGPTAAEVKWDLTLPKDPMPANKYLSENYINRLPSYVNDSREMDSAIATMMLPDNLPLAIPRLCEALSGSGFNDLYAGSMLAMNLIKEGKTAMAKPLLPFLVKASEHVSDPDDLANFAYIVAMFRDRRVVPRLIELMDHNDENVRDGAKTAVAAVTLLPEKGLTSEKARNWWNLNYNVSDQQIYTEQLNSRDPKVAVQAALALYEYRDKAIMPVLIKLLTIEDQEVNGLAIAVIAKVAGNDWSYNAAGPSEDKVKRAKAIENWWKEEQFKFKWIEDKAIESTKPKSTNANDPCVQWVGELASVEGNKAQVAEANLFSKGEPAVPALIDGLGSQTVVVRRKCHDLLKRITKQNVVFDAADSEDLRAQGVEAWKKFAREKKLLAEPAKESDEEEQETEEDESDGKHPSGKKPDR
jgi:hypothetical protein